MTKIINLLLYICLFGNIIVSIFKLIGSIIFKNDYDLIIGLLHIIISFKIMDLIEEVKSD